MWRPGPRRAAGVGAGSSPSRTTRTGADAWLGTTAGRRAGLTSANRQAERSKAPPRVMGGACCTSLAVRRTCGEQDPTFLGCSSRGGVVQCVLERGAP